MEIGNNVELPLIIYEVSFVEGGIKIKGSANKLGIEFLEQCSNVSEADILEIFKPVTNAIEYCSNELNKKIAGEDEK